MCWCKGTKNEIFPYPELDQYGQWFADMTEFYRFISELPCRDHSCNYLEPHSHGFACDVTCKVCLRLTHKEV